MVETFFAIGVVLLVGAVRWALDRAGSDAATRSWQRHDAFYADPQNRKLTKRSPQGLRCSSPFSDSARVPLARAAETQCSADPSG